MHNPPAEFSNLQVEIYNDDLTPVHFVIDLLRSVVNFSEDEALSLAATIDKQGNATCGIFPPKIANAIVESAQERIKAAGFPLQIKAFPFGSNQLANGSASGFNDNSGQTARKLKFKYAHEAVAWHFAGLSQEELVTTSRQFPGHMRADLQIAIDGLFSKSPIRFFGIYEQHRYETLTFAAITKTGQNAATISAAQFQEVEIGDGQAVKCLNNGLWLCAEGGLRYAVVLSSHREFGQESGTCVEIAVPVGELGSVLVQRCFDVLENAMSQARSYRGKVLSLENEANYRGRGSAILVHRLPTVRRDEVVLPEATLKLLDRNIINFVEKREFLRKLGQSTRKGILLYGPPGTAKTHTIRYLAGSLPGHTALIITAEQISLLRQYMSLARLLQPSMVVIEDVDLIARSREQMSGPCEETMLNALLNEMDGLKENTDIIFVLTTNRPEQLESALAGRPGRIDQAIEVPLPDHIGREKLVRLYGSSLKLSEQIIRESVVRTKGASAAFIKELMRRTAQSGIAHGRTDTVSSDDLREALDDMLFSGGKLNASLLGGIDAQAAAEMQIR